MLYNDVLDIKFNSIICVGAVFDYVVLNHITNDSNSDVSNVILC